MASGNDFQNEMAKSIEQFNLHIRDVQRLGINNGHHSDSETPESYGLTRKNHPKAMTLKLFEFYRKNKYKDITVSLRDGFIRCHKIVLASNSEYFENILDNNLVHEDKIIMLPDVSHYIFSNIVEYMYTGEIMIPHIKFKEFMVIASFLKIKSLDLGMQSSPAAQEMESKMKIGRFNDDKKPRPTATVTSKDHEEQQLLVNGGRQQQHSSPHAMNNNNMAAHIRHSQYNGSSSPAHVSHLNGPSTSSPSAAADHLDNSGMNTLIAAAEVFEAKKGRKGYHPKKKVRQTSPRELDQALELQNGLDPNSPRSDHHHNNGNGSSHGSTTGTYDDDAPMVIDEQPMDFSSSKDKSSPSNNNTTQGVSDLAKEIAEKQNGKRYSILDKFSFLKRQRHNTDDGASTSSAPPVTEEQQRQYDAEAAAARQGSTALNTFQTYLDMFKMSHKKTEEPKRETVPLSQTFGIDIAERLRQHFIDAAARESYNQTAAAAAAAAAYARQHNSPSPDSGDMPQAPEGAGGYTDLSLGMAGEFLGGGGVGVIGGAQVNHAAAGEIRQQRGHQPRKNKRGSKGTPASANISLDEFGQPKMSMSGKPIVRCEKCGKELADPSSLYRHRKIHSGDKPHQCPFCQRKFIQRYNMRQHLKTHRKGGITQEMIDSLSPDLQKAFYSPTKVVEEDEEDKSRDDQQE